MNDESRTEFGPLLRHAREKRGMSLQQVAATTKISARVLDALERNDPSKLPGGIFSRAFVRAYAREVGLDPEETVNRFMAAFPPDTEEAAPQAPGRIVDADGFESQRRTAMTLFQIVGLSAVVLIAVAIYMNMRREPEVSTPPEPPARMTFETQPPASEPATSPAASGPGAIGALPAATPAAGETAAAAPPTVVTTAAPAAPQTSAAAPASAAASPLSLVIVADAECWLSLSVDGTRVVARNLQPGERVQYAAQNAFVISAGNAGALALTINGKPARPLGGRGEVVTTTVTLENLSRILQ